MQRYSRQIPEDLDNWRDLGPMGDRKLVLMVFRVGVRLCPGT
jgi:hypothetical protein